VKEFLSREGRAYIERNVDDDPSAYDELLARGWRSVPVTVIGDESIRGWDPAALRAALERYAPGTLHRPEPEPEPEHEDENEN
jgi:glutaredoxin